MKPYSQILLAVLMLAADVRSVSAQSFPIPVTLDGIAVIFDDHRAMFKTTTVAGEFSLREGEKYFGIKLLSIDLKSSCVLIDNRGEVQTLHICNPPSLISTSGENGGSSNGETTATGILAAQNAETTGDRSEIATNFIATHPEFFLAGNGGSGAAKNPATTSPAAGNTEASPPPTGGTDASQTPTTEVYYWWMKDAQKMEVARLQTADRVLAGEWPPYPRTPLTPPGTSPRLVNETMDMNYGPGIIIQRR
jgi:hypothetical protein